MGYWEVNRNHIFKEMFIVSKKKKRERERKKGRKKERKREKEKLLYYLPNQNQIKLNSSFH